VDEQRSPSTAEALTAVEAATAPFVAGVRELDEDDADELT
jgi:hypothetical protein